MAKAKKPQVECVIPPAIDVMALPDMVFGQPPHEEQRVRGYMAWQCGDEKVLHLERVGGEALMGRKMGFWDVTTDRGKWWVITNPTNLYSQALFPSLDYTVSFHVGVTTRMTARERGSEANARVRRIMPTLKKLEAAGVALDDADEAEEFQAVGVKLRDCLLSLARSISKTGYVPEGEEPPQRDNFIRWTELIADALAAGPSAKEARSYLKAIAKNTWQLVNWVTHASNAVAHDAKLAHSATENVVGAFFNAVQKRESKAPDRCPECGSYRVTEDYRPDLGIDPPYIVLCERCEWITPQQVPPEKAKAALAAAGIAEKVRLSRKKGAPKGA